MTIQALIHLFPFRTWSNVPAVRLYGVLQYNTNDLDGVCMAMSRLN